MELKLEHCVLRDWKPGDEASIARHANNRNVWRNLRDLFPHPYTERHAADWIVSVTSRKPQTIFAIAVDGAAVGGVGLHPGTDVYRRSAEIGFWLGEPYWGRGIMTEAVRAITKFGFAKLDICRIYASVFEWNPASMRVLEKAGYTLEGRHRKAVTKDGRTIDELIYAIVRERAV